LFSTDADGHFTPAEVSSTVFDCLVYARFSATAVATFLGPAEWSSLNSLMSILGQLALRLGLVPKIGLKSWPASYWTGTGDTKTASQATISEGTISEAANGHERS
jgi:hypothetical protein